MGRRARSDFVNTSFDGLEELTDPEQGANGKAILITIHGMCHHDKSWFEESTCHFAAALNKDPPEVKPVAIDGGEPVQVFRSDIPLEKWERELRIYGIVFSPVTQGAKAHLCRDVDQETDVCTSDMIRPGGKRKYTRKRAEWNARGKSELMNNCIADAVAYLGPKGEEVRQGVRHALTSIAGDISADPDYKHAPIAVLTESLGSKILTDVLLGASRYEKRELEAVFEPDRVKVVFYGANQLPLLNLGSQGYGCGADQDSDVGLAEALKAETIVAFTDPNDLLSYEVHPEDVCGSRDIYNVIVSNTPSWFGLGARPDHAHKWYRVNPDVVAMIVCGRDENGNSRCGQNREDWLAADRRRKHCERYANPEQRPSWEGDTAIVP